MLKAGAVRGCKPGASDDERADQPTKEESRDAPAPGAWSLIFQAQLPHAEVSVHPHRVQMHPVLVHFGNYDEAPQII